MERTPTGIIQAVVDKLNADIQEIDKKLDYSGKTIAQDWEHFAMGQRRYIIEMLKLIQFGDN